MAKTEKAVASQKDETTYTDFKKAIRKNQKAVATLEGMTIKSPAFKEAIEKLKEETEKIKGACLSFVKHELDQIGKEGE